MKWLFYGVILVLIFGCAGQGVNRAPLKDTVTLIVEAADAVTLTEQLPYNKSDNPYLHPSGITKMNETKTKAFIQIFSNLSISDFTRLYNDLVYIQLETNIREIDILIFSSGGDAFTGLALADLILRARSEYGLKFNAYAYGIVASAAVPIFAVCDFRTASKGAIFMVHEAALWKWPGRETASDIRSQNNLMIMLQDRYLNYLVTNSKLTLKEWKEKEKATTWFSAQEAFEYGIADRVQ